MAGDSLLDQDVMRYADGQMQALVAFALALAKTHQDPSLLLRHFEEASRAALSRSESLAPDNSAEAAQQISQRILAVLRKAAAQQAMLSNR